MSRRSRRVWMAVPAVLLVAGLLVAGLLAPVTAAAATDPDRDRLPNTWERAYSLTNPYRADSDRDGLLDGREDPDRDGLTNRQEYLAGMHPRRADTDRDGLRDGREDTDRDGLRTTFEFLAGTSPRRTDTDRDGIRDGRENPDRDGLTNAREQKLGTKPRVADTDGDGWSDGAEWRAGTDPRRASTPSPDTARPFAAPVTTRTVNVPSTIDSTGATNAAAALQTFIGSVPDGSVIVFKAGGVYRMDRGIAVQNRRHLVFEGNGATLRANGSSTSMWADPFVIYGSSTDVSDIVIRNFTLQGNNPRTGTDIYDPSQEAQHGVGVYGGSRIEIANNTIRNTWGDGVYAANGSTQDWANDLWVHDNTFDYIGRNAFTINAAQQVLLERNTIDQVGGSVMNIEPDLSFQGATNVTLRANTVGVWGLSPLYTMHFVACANNNVGVGAVIRGLTITGNHVSQGAPSSVNTPNAGGLSTWIGKSRTSNVTFANNTTTKAGKGAVLIFEHVDGLTVTGNTQPLTSGSLTYISDSTTVTSQ